MREEYIMAQKDGLTTYTDFTMTIDGTAAPSVSTFDVINPATEELAGRAPDATREQLDAAVHAAAAAFPKWAALSISARQAKLAEIAAMLRANEGELARIFTAEQGRPYDGAVWEVGVAATWCEAMSTFDIPIEVIDDSEVRRVELQRVPIGVVGAICPWNAPLLMAIWKIAPAILTGNTVVLKPSPYTPLTTLRFGELIRGILPQGVVNIVTGGNELGRWITDHPGIGKVSFTGSIATGRKVMESAASTLKRVTLELGGNDAAIVLPDADPKVVAPQLFWGAFFNSAQVCVAIKRLYLHEDIYDAVADELVKIAETVKIGDGSQQGIELGPVQNKAQFDKVSDLIRSTEADGHRFLTGGMPKNEKGYFIPISIVDNPPEDSRVVTEEAFGPVLPLLKFSDLDEVIERANAGDTGLGATIWTNDVEKACSIARRLETGTVWINEVFAFLPNAPFGGHKQSGIGVEHGVNGLLEYTNSRTVTSRKLAPAA